MGEPRISVVIPARNEESFIEAALSSVAGQHYPHDRLEAIVVDNGSADGTAARVHDVAGQVTDLAVQLVNEPVAGVGRAKNTGVDVARGEIIIFLDADSRMTPNLAADVARSYGAGAPAGSIRVAADTRHPVDRGFFALMEVGKVWFGVRGQMMYCERRLFQEVGGFDPALHLAEDLEFLKRVKARLRAEGSGEVSHIRSSAILTSPRRLRAGPLRLGMFAMFGRWLLAFAGIGRSRRY